MKKIYYFHDEKIEIKEKKRPSTDVSFLTFILLSFICPNFKLNLI